MSITDELRKFAGRWPSTDYICKDMLAIADRIDAEHEMATSEFWAKINAVPATDENMAEHGWVRLPKDAEGEYIHIGDVMEWPDGKTFDVVGIGDGVLFYIENADGPADWTGASTKRHHHAPTVEDVMVEFAIDWESAQDGEDKTAVLKEYAAKLRLAGDGE